MPALRAALYGANTAHLQNIRKIYMMPESKIQYSRTDYDEAVRIAKERAASTSKPVASFKINDLI